MPLFHWYLDGNLTSAFKLSDLLNQSPKEHQKFLEAVVVDLLQEGDFCRIHPGPPSLATLPKPFRDNHEWIDLKSIRACFMCRIDFKNRGFGREVNGIGVMRHHLGVDAGYAVFLCRPGNCAQQFHEMESSIRSEE